MSAAERTGFSIITDLYNLTGSMAKQLNDPDFLVQCVDKRQALMDEYDAFREKHSDSSSANDMVEIKRMVKEILEMDHKINDALSAHKSEAKDKLTEIQGRQKAMTYASGNVSSSGSYMDYKK